MANQIVVSAGAKVRNLSGVLTATSGVVSSLPIDVSLGIPQLDVNGKILVSQLPNSVMEYKGTWDAATNTPTLANGTGNQGDVYLCNVAGTVDFGAGAIAFVVSDQAIYSGSIWQKASGSNGTVTSVAITESGDSLNITGSPIVNAGTINIGFNGTNLQYVNGAGNLTTFPTLTGYVPYTGATANVDLGAFDLTADLITGATGSFASSGGSDTFAINHSSGGGIALNITKGGNGEGLYINKTSGSGNAATIVGTLEATTLVKNGGTSSQFLKADGTVDSNTYALDSLVVHLAGTETITGAKTFSATSLTLAPTSGGGTLNLKQDAFLGATNGYTSLTSSGSDFAIITATGVSTSKQAVFSLASLGATLRTYTLPDANGILALTSDIPSLTGYVTLATTQTITGIKTFSSFDTLFSQGFFSDYAIKIKKDGSISLLNGYVSIGEISGTGTSKIVFGDGNSAFSNSLLFNTSSDKIYTFPNASGTIALTSDLSAYVTLAGTETITGAKTFSGLTSFTNTSGINLQYGAYINKGNTPLAFSSNNTNIYSDATTNNIVIRDNLSIAKLEFNNSTQTYTFPAATGTIALTSDLTGGTVTSVAALTIGTTGTDLSSTVANSTTTPVITLNVPTASAVNRGALSSADWTTFNNKQSALTNPVTGTGTTNYLPKFTGASTIGNSILYEAFGGVVVGGPIYAADGTSTSASIRFFNANSGLYNAPSDALGFITSGTSKMILNASGNLGLGVTPSAWSFGKALEVGNTGNSIYSYSIGDMYMTRNAYFDTTWKYANTGTASRYNQFVGYHIWESAVSGSAAANITFTPLMTLTPSGRLLIGTSTESTYLLDVNGTGRFSSSVTAVGLSSTTSALGNLNALIRNGVTSASGTTGYGLAIESEASAATSYALTVRNLAGSNTYFLISTETGKVGNVGIGTVSPNARLSLGTGTTSKLLVYDGGFTGSGGNGFFAGFAVDYPSGNDFGMFAHNNGALVFGKYTNNNDLNNVTERMRITSTGNVGIGTTSPTGKLMIEATGNHLFLRASSATAGKYWNFDVTSANQLYIVNNAGTQYLTITDGGNVGINTTTPATQLNILYPSNIDKDTVQGVIRLTGQANAENVGTNFSSGTAVEFYNKWNGGGSNAEYAVARISGRASQGYKGGLQFDVGTGSSAGGTTFSTAMGILTNGNVLIGTTDDGGRLVSYSTTAATQIKAAGTAPAITFSNTVLSPTYGGVLGTCTSAGQFLSGTAAGDMVLANQFSGYRVYVASYSGGVYLTSGATSWTANSDIRLKNINSHIENAVEKLSTLQTINFSYKDDKTNKQNLGLIAQEVEKIFPELIDKNGDGMLGVRYTELVPVLIKAIQEQQKEINELKLKIK
jgi:hypothetical protein